MRFSPESADGSNLIRAYQEGAVVVNGQRDGRRNEQRIEHSVVITADVVEQWPPQRFADCGVEHFTALIEHRPELVIFGTGAAQRFPHPSLTRPLLEQGIGVEVMDTAAACRTYNIVAAEGRRVAAALLMI